MNMNVTVDPACNDTVKANAVRWISEAAQWSAVQYGKVDIESNTTWSVEPHQFNAVTMQPQHRPIRIRMSEVDNVGWSPEIQEREWFKSQLFHTGFEIGIKAAAVGLLRTVKFTLAKDIDDQQYRANWDSTECPMEEKLAFIKQTYPNLIDFWTDRSGWLDDHVSKLRRNRWQFPAVNPKLCRSGTWGPGMVFPEGSGRK